MSPRSQDPPIDPALRVGHVHLRTADIDPRPRVLRRDDGFDVVFEARDVPGWGTTGDILFLSAGGYHHHLGFNTWKSAGGGPAWPSRHHWMKVGGIALLVFLLVDSTIIECE